MNDSNNSAVADRQRREKESALKSPWVRGWLAMVGVIVAANVVMMVIAWRTSPGLVVKDYYEKGKNYNKTLQRRAAESKLGWQADLLLPADSVAGKEEQVSLAVSGKEGAPLAAAEVIFYAYRPSDSKADFSLPMHYGPDGRFSCLPKFPQPGNWDVIVSVKSGEDLLDIPRRIFVKKGVS